MLLEQKADFTKRNLTDFWEHCGDNVRLELKERGLKTINCKKFSRICTEFFNVVYEKVFNGDDVVLPFGNGTMYVRKVAMIRKPRFITETINYLTPFLPIVFWNRKSPMTIFRYKLPRRKATILNRMFFKEGYDYPEIEDYEFFHKRYDKKNKT